MGKRKTGASTAPGVVPTLALLPAGLFRVVETLCKDAILYGGNAAGLRKSIGSLYHHLRTVANDDLGHDSIEVVALRRLLTRSDPARAGKLRPRLRPTAAAWLSERKLLTPVQYSAMHRVITVWDAFGRYLTVSGNQYKTGRSRRSRVLQPVDVMSQELWDSWRDSYCPWYGGALRRRFSTSGGSCAKMVIDVVISGYYPHQLDKVYQLTPKTTIKWLRTELDTLAKFMPRQHPMDQALDKLARDGERP